MTPLRWGFLGTAGIARKNWLAVRAAENCVLTTVASRDTARAQTFINDCQASGPFAQPPRALGSYEALLASPEVDAVYIPLPTALRHEWVIRAARAGKHVLCEKPGDTSAEELERMLVVCRENHVQFMDGVMFMHNPRLNRIRSVLDDGASVGPIRRIMSIFSFLGNDQFWRDNIRTSGELEPAGCLGDLGWYCLRFALWAMKWQAPSEVTGRILSAQNRRTGALTSPLEFSGELFFANGVSAGFYCSFAAPNQRWVNVSGTHGSLRLDDFVHPFNPHEPAYQLNDTALSVKVCDCAGPHDQSIARAQDVNMFRNFANQVRSGRLNEEWPGWTLKTQWVQDACLKSALAGGQSMPVTAF
jgi:predicted dehydrogenase